MLVKGSSFVEASGIGLVSLRNVSPTLLKHEARRHQCFAIILAVEDERHETGKQDVCQITSFVLYS
jgi:hypothetical protein